MKQWSEIIRNVTMLSQLGLVSYHTASAVSGGLLADCFQYRSWRVDFYPRFLSLDWEVLGQWHINFIFLLTDSRGKRTKRRKIKYRLTDTCNRYRDGREIYMSIMDNVQPAVKKETGRVCCHYRNRAA